MKSNHLFALFVAAAGFIFLSAATILASPAAHQLMAQQERAKQAARQKEVSFAATTMATGSPAFTPSSLAQAEAIGFFFFGPTNNYWSATLYGLKMDYPLGSDMYDTRETTVLWNGDLLFAFSTPHRSALQKTFLPWGYWSSVPAQIAAITAKANLICAECHY